jgi:hypothetical protein
MLHDKILVERYQKSEVGTELSWVLSPPKKMSSEEKTFLVTQPFIKDPHREFKKD